MSLIYEKSCGTIVIKDNQVLIIESLEGIYGFPKGHVENNETEIETALRETKEETNLDVLIEDKYRFITNYIVNDNINKDVVYFIASPIEPIDIVPQDEEIKSIKWVNFEDVESLLQYDNIKKIWLEALNAIQKRKSKN